jgi:ubiquitin-like-conjugating enzyme ATG3
MEEDISADHMRETVTVDPFPHIDKLTTMSIHPCKHANTMKVFGDQQIANGKAFPVAHYLILFLKFISGVVPTIEYDYSMEYSMS